MLLLSRHANESRVKIPRVKMRVVQTARQCPPYYKKPTWLVLVVVSILMHVVSCSVAEATIKKLMTEGVEVASAASGNDCASTRRACESDVGCRAALSDFRVTCHLPMKSKTMEACMRCKETTTALKSLSLGQAFLACDCMQDQLCTRLKLLARVCPRGLRKRDAEEDEDDTEYQEDFSKCTQALASCLADAACEQDVKTDRTVSCVTVHPEDSLQSRVKEACFFCG